MKKISCIAAAFLILFSAGKTAYGMKKNTGNMGYSNRQSQDDVPANVLREKASQKHREIQKLLLSLRSGMHELLWIGGIMSLSIETMEDKMKENSDIYDNMKFLLSDNEKNILQKIMGNAHTCFNHAIDFKKKLQDTPETFFLLNVKEQLEQRNYKRFRNNEVEFILKDIDSGDFFKKVPSQNSDLPPEYKKYEDFIKWLVTEKNLFVMQTNPQSIKIIKEEFKKLQENFSIITQRISDISLEKAQRETYKNLIFELKELQDICTSIVPFNKTGKKFFYKILRSPVNLEEREKRSNERLEAMKNSLKKLGFSFYQQKLLESIEIISQKIAEQRALEQEIFNRTHAILPICRNIEINRESEKFNERLWSRFYDIAKSKKDELAKIEKSFREKHGELKTYFENSLNEIRKMTDDLGKNIPSDFWGEDEKFIDQKMPQDEGENVVMKFQDDFASEHRPAQEEEKEEESLQSRKRNPRKEEQKEEKIHFIQHPLRKKSEKHQTIEEIQKKMVELKDRETKLEKERKSILQELDNKAQEFKKIFEKDKSLQTPALKKMLHAKNNTIDERIQKIEHSNSFNIHQKKAITHVFNQMDSYFKRRDNLERDYEQEKELIEDMPFENFELSQEWETLGKSIQQDLFDESGAYSMGNAQKSEGSSEEEFKKIKKEKNKGKKTSAKKIRKEPDFQ